MTISDRRFKVLIVDDHPSLAFGTKIIVEQLTSAKVIGIAATGSKGVSMAIEHRPDIILLDLALPDMHGVEVAREIRTTDKNVLIAIYTGEEHVDENYIEELLEIGIQAFIQKTTPPDKLIKAIELILDGQVVFPSSLYKQIRCKAVVQSKLFGLKDLDIKILELLSDGKTNSEISQSLHVSVKTVESRLTHIYRKLGVSGRFDAVRKFQQT